jgi:hypothetical protein
VTVSVAHAHDQNCWRFTDRCALERAKVALETRESYRSEIRTRDLLAVVRMALRAGHVDEPCPDGADCFAVQQARQFLAEAS